MANISYPESATGRGFTQGSDSYNPADVAREERERAAKRQPVAEPKFEGDPNFGDYNIPPGGNHP
jgi:hypothetical protein